MNVNCTKVWLGIAAIILIFIPLAAVGGEVDVKAEGAYTFGESGGNGDLAVYIYADIATSDPLVSFGVKLQYDDNKLSNPIAAINDTDWYMKSGETTHFPTLTHPGIETSAGEVICFGGRLDEANPTAGVTGTRKLLCKVTFDRLEDTDPKADIGGPEGHFGLSLDIGKVNPSSGKSFDNFVTTEGDVKDPPAGVEFVTNIVRRRGDANADGTVNISDVTEIRKMVFNQIPKTVYADCNNDTFVNISDVTCIRGIVFP